MPETGLCYFALSRSLEKIVFEVDEYGDVVPGRFFADSRALYIATDNGTAQNVVVKFANNPGEEAKRLEELVDVPQTPVLVHADWDYIAMSMDVAPEKTLPRPASYYMPPDKFILATAQLIDFLKRLADKGVHYNDFHGKNVLFDENSGILSVVDYALITEQSNSRRSLMTEGSPIKLEI